MDYEIHGKSIGQSLSWERIELCNDGKCQLRARKERRRGKGARE